MGFVIIAVLRSSDWGWILPAEGAPSVLGMSLVVWFILVGLGLMLLFMQHVRRREARGSDPLVHPELFRNRQMTGGLLMFFFQFLVMMGLFFAIPLYLSVALGLSAIDTGLRLMPLSVTMLLAAAGVPRFFPTVSPRRVVNISMAVVVLGIIVLFAAIDVEATAEVVTGPLLLIGLGLGGLASQLGAVTVSAVPDSESPEVGGLQNTATQFGASLGTALAGSILIAALTASFLTGIDQNPAVPDEVVAQANVQLSSGGEFISDQQLETALADAGVRRDHDAGDRGGERAGTGRRLARYLRAPGAVRAHRAVLHEPDPDGAADGIAVTRAAPRNRRPPPGSRIARAVRDEVGLDDQVAGSTRTSGYRW